MWSAPRAPVPCWTFIRHGESVANAAGVLAGHRDSPLTERGREQALTLRAILQDLRFDAVWCSDLARARATATLALPGQPLTEEPRLRERHFGSWEGRPRSELEATGVSLVDPGLIPPSGESTRAVEARVRSFLASVPSGVSALVFTHGGWIRAALGLLDRDASTHPLTLRIPNAGIQVRAR